MGAERRGTDVGGNGVASTRPENTAAGQQAPRAALMAKASALVPLLRARAAETERERRLGRRSRRSIDDGRRLS